MAKTKSKSGGQRKANRHSISNRIQNAFDIAEDKEDGRLLRGGIDADLDGGRNYSDDDSKPAYRIGEVASEDDEEIDSDEAMGSDEDDILESHRRKKDDESEDEGYTSIDEADLRPLSEVWDLDEKNEKSGNVNVEELKLDDDILSDSENEADSESQSGSEDEDEDEEEDSESDLDLSDDYSMDGDDIDEEKLEGLKSLISNMSEEALEEERRKSKKQRLEIMNLQEGEYSLPVAGQKLSLADLTAGVRENTQSLKLLDEKKKQTLSIPLAKRIQQKIDRKVAYELTKDEVTKWEATVKANREAEHLQFPINPAPQVLRQAVHAPVEPSTELEKKVSSLLEQSNLSEKSLSTFEELAPSKLTMEEVKRRRNELRMMRELMFREEQKARRIKKIKSKSYRKVHKRERERERAMVEDDEESDREAHDIERARERISLKHKNTGKWAKRMVEQGFTKDKGTRTEMEEMLRRGEDLRKKILNDNDNSEDDEDDNEDEDEDDDELINNQKESLGKGLLTMKFMKDAEEREKQANKTQREALRNAKTIDDFEDLGQEVNSVNQVVNAGRRTFAPGASLAKDEALEELEKARQEQDIDEEKSIVSVITKSFQKDKRKSQQNDSDSDETNPWLEVSTKPKQKSNKIVSINKNSSSQEKAQDKLRKQKSKSKDSSVSGDIDMNELLHIVDPLASDQEDNEDHDSDNDNDSNNTIKPAVSSTKGLTFKQRDLVKRAFAGDDVVEEFQQEKRQIIEDEGDKEVDMTLPGWGSWGGKAIQPRKKIIKKIEGIKADKRKDSKLKNVIINEKVNKKNDKYTASAVPFPYENREQYERSLRMPIGREWSSRETFQKLTKPRIIVKPGTVIDPIKAPFK